MEQERIDEDARDGRGYVSTREWCSHFAFRTLVPARRLIATGQLEAIQIGRLWQIRREQSRAEWSVK